MHNELTFIYIAQETNCVNNTDKYGKRKSYNNQQGTESDRLCTEIFKEFTSPSPNQGIPNQVPWLGLVSLFQIWDFYGYSLNTLKYPKMGIRYFFLWIILQLSLSCLQQTSKMTRFIVVEFIFNFFHTASCVSIISDHHRLMLQN